MANRDRDEIIALILQACQEPATRTKIMYKSLLNFHQVNAYVELLTKTGMLDDRPENRTFVTTSKGNRYLELYNGGIKLANGLETERNNMKRKVKP